jgi:hypothetical protein
MSYRLLNDATTDMNAANKTPNSSDFISAQVGQTGSPSLSV